VGGSGTATVGLPSGLSLAESLFVDDAASVVGVVDEGFCFPAS
jgi:hypothetical protein